MQRDDYLSKPIAAYDWLDTLDVKPVDLAVLLKLVHDDSPKNGKRRGIIVASQSGLGTRLNADRTTIAGSLDRLCDLGILELDGVGYGNIKRYVIVYGAVPS